MASSVKIPKGTKLNIVCKVLGAINDYATSSSGQQITKDIMTKSGCVLAEAGMKRVALETICHQLNVITMKDIALLVDVEESGEQGVDPLKALENVASTAMIDEIITRLKVKYDTTHYDFAKSQITNSVMMLEAIRLVIERV